MSQSGSAEAKLTTMRDRRWGKLALWLPVYAWMAVIYVLSAQSQLPTPKQGLLHWLIENLAHPSEYAVLAWLLWRPLTGAGRRPSSGANLTAWAIAFIYALLDEYHQSFVPGRVADWRDLLTDTLGAATVLVVLSIPPVARLYTGLTSKVLRRSC
ncbi:MAG: VanZ family protein [Anaerolineae bacterium]